MRRAFSCQRLTRRSFLRLGAMGITNILLPQFPFASVVESQPLSSPRLPAPLLPPSAFTILVADEDVDLMTVFQVVLERSGFHIIKQADGRKAYEDCRQQPIALIISYISKFDLNGLELLEMIRADPITQHVPLLFVTAVGDAEDLQRAFALGANAYLTKPCNPKDLIESAAAFLPVKQTWIPLEDKFERLGSSSVLIVPDNSPIVPQSMPSMRMSEFVTLRHSESHHKGA